jgi:hypothetical protein
MRELRKQERTAMDAVAKKFSATWEEGSGLHDAYLRIAGKRVAVEIGILKHQGKSEKPRLRFDKVATRVLQRLRDACVEVVPDGMTVLLTITSPIRLASKTADDLEDRLNGLVGGRVRPRDIRETIHGNSVEVRVVRDASKRVPKLIGFVHNPETDPSFLLSTTSTWLELVGQARRDSWLVVIGGGDPSWLEAHRVIYSQLGVENEIQTVMMVFGDGSVESLTR